MMQPVLLWKVTNKEYLSADTPKVQIRRIFSWYYMLYSLCCSSFEFAGGRHLLSVGQGITLPRRQTWIFRIMLMKS